MTKKIIAFAGKQGCVDEETQYLSKTGWKYIKDYSGEEIAVVDKDCNIHFEQPSDYISVPADKWYFIQSGYGLNQKLSPEHKVWYITSKGNWCYKTAEVLYEKVTKASRGHNGKLIPYFKADGDLTLPYEDDYLRLLIAIQADGTRIKIKGTDTPKVALNLKKERKKRRLEMLLKSCNIQYTASVASEEASNFGFTKYTFYIPDYFKEFPSDWYNLNYRQLSIIADEVSLWDGYFDLRNGNPSYYTTIKNNADFIQFVFAVVRGTRSSIHIDDRLGDIHKSICYQVASTSRQSLNLLTKKPLPNTEKMIHVEEAKEGELKYCFTTSTGMWLMRRGNDIVITGNSGKDFRCKQLVNKGFKQMAYADALRKIMFVTLGMSYEYGMEHYEELKMTPLYNGQTLRNMLEHLGTEGIRSYDNDFWAKCLLRDIEKTSETQDVCISDLRFYNEYKTLKSFCDEHGYEFQLIFCDYHSERYEAHNPHASARLANFLGEIGYGDGDIVKDEDMVAYITAMEDIKS